MHTHRPFLDLQEIGPRNLITANKNFLGRKTILKEQAICFGLLSQLHCVQKLHKSHNLAMLTSGVKVLLITPFTKISAVQLVMNCTHHLTTLRTHLEGNLHVLRCVVSKG